MDKQRAKAKAKRRSERRMAEREYNKDLAEQFNAKFKEQGLKHKFKPNEIGRAYRELQNEITKEAIVINSIITLYVMHCLYRYGAKRLHRLAGEIAARVTDVGRERRTITQLNGDLLWDAHLNYRTYWDKQELKDVNGAEIQRRNMLLSTAWLTLPIQLTAVFHTLFPMGSISRKSVRMERITRSICGTVRHAIENNMIDTYRREIEKCGLKITMEGQFASSKLSEDEAERLQRRIIA